MALHRPGMTKPGNTGVANVTKRRLTRARGRNVALTLGRNLRESPLFRSPTIVLLASLAAAVVLTACVVPPPTKPIAKYVPPTDGQTAKLVMRGTLPAGDNYGVYVYSDSEKCTDLRSVGTGTNTRNPASTPRKRRSCIEGRNVHWIVGFLRVAPLSIGPTHFGDGGLKSENRRG